MKHCKSCLLVVTSLVLLLASGFSQHIQPKEADFVMRDFHFRSGETLPELKIHYRTIGNLQRDAAGHATNAVLLLHGTGGSSVSFVGQRFAAIFQAGQALDASRYFIIIPDGIGHGKSSKPSDGMHARFPHYEYEDMIEAQYRLLTEGLKIDHLQLVSGVSMGGMHTWMWGEEHPEFMDRLFPLVCMPIEIAGRNRLWRDFAMYLLSSDPEYNNGEYKQEPHGVAETITLFDLVLDGPHHLQETAPNRDAADALFGRWTAHAAENRDANDLLYALNASRNYNPEPNLEKIRANLVAVNAADDFINPPDLGVMDKLIARVKHGKFVLIPVSAGAHGHSSGGDPALWKRYLAELMEEKASDK
jgi:homoserine O-acetyltransferase